ncbi:Endo-13 [Spathaspora sp. JA1]|nr:Endo-13 [Spathaspora sp. JA1]
MLWTSLISFAVLGTSFVATEPTTINIHGKPVILAQRDDASTPSTTSTIYQATTSPANTQYGKIVFFPISSMKNPLATEGISESVSLTNPIQTSTLSQAVIVTQSFETTSQVFFSISTSSALVDLPLATDTSATTVGSTLASSGSSTLASSGSSTLASPVSSSVSEPIQLEKRATTPSLVKVAISNANGFTGDLFLPISTSDVTSVFKKTPLPLSIPSGVSNGDTKYQTNKFYANLLLGDQTSMIWSYPYGLNYIKSNYFGFGVQRTLADQRVFGTTNTNNPNIPSYFFNPIMIDEMIVSATAFTSASNTKITVSSMKVNSVDVKLSTDGKATTNYVYIPVVQGMGFITSIYYGNLVPRINSNVGFKTLAAEQSSKLTNANLLRYRATLFNGVQYLIYAKLPSGKKTTDFSLKVTNTNTITGSKAISGLIVQYAIAATAAHNTYYDEAAGMYVTECKVKAHGYGGTSAEYVLAYSKKGSSISNMPMVFALPHIVESVDSTTKQYNTGISLTSTNKGDMKGFRTDTLVMVETLNTNIQFLPWVQEMGTKAPSWTSAQLKLISQVANSELSVDINKLVNSQNSNYFSGKVLDKYAYILYVVSDIIGDQALTKSLLATLKTTFATFRNNKQFYPLMYDTKFGGITSTAYKVSNDVNADYGSSYYNDHHYHYGYFIHAAAIIGYVDKKAGGTWAKDQQPWVNALVRDAANPSPGDPYFPVFRMFDWFQGHSWASGLFEGGDGRNEESSSEDYNFSYAIKLWGKVTGNKRMESYGDLMLAVMKRSMNKYFLYSSSNTVEPSQYIGNKVSGILFENKIAYTTYFGNPDTNPEYVHGIHMLPITPASSLIRGSGFVKEEWTSQISTFISKVNSGWTGILRLNQALYDAKSAYSFFSSSSWKDTYLDNGQSRTWGLTFSAGVMNALA